MFFRARRAFKANCSSSALPSLSRPSSSTWPRTVTSGQSWGTFLRNHAPHIAATDLFVVPTVGFIQLYVLVIVQLARRELVWINVTRHPGRVDRRADN
jgi:hypothetical protein